MLWQWLFLFLLAAALPARADDLVSISQLVAALSAGALPANLLATGAAPANAFGNVSVISQVGSGNTAQTDQTGTRDIAAVSQVGHNFSASILQTSQRDVAAISQIGNGLGAPPITITQTGPAQSIVIIQHR